MDQENKAIKQCKANDKQYTPTLFPNGDSAKQLLARSRCLLYKSPDKWTPNQNTDIKIAYTKLAHWYKEVEESGFKSFQNVANSITLNYRSILNYFINRSTNASAKSFNAKIKAFRAQFREDRNTKYLIRLSKLDA
ncbi:transposase [Galbibacter sp. EGI 63066]|uniref:transposase n=1 Tax=Galbibacter sp. EGI 63066 TaxID=2993559 RepID=UPI002B054D4D